MIHPRSIARGPPPRFTWGMHAGPTAACHVWRHMCEATATHEGIGWAASLMDGDTAANARGDGCIGRVMCSSRFQASRTASLIALFMPNSLHIIYVRAVQRTHGSYGNPIYMTIIPCICIPSQLTSFFIKN